MRSSIEVIDAAALHPLLDRKAVLEVARATPGVLSDTDVHIPNINFGVTGWTLVERFAPNGARLFIVD